MEEGRETGKGNRSGRQASLVGKDSDVVPWRRTERRKLKAGICLEEGTGAFKRGQRERRWRDEGRKAFVVGHDISFRDGEVPVEDVEELAFHPADIFLGEGARPTSPPCVFDGVI